MRQLRIGGRNGLHEFVSDIVHYGEEALKCHVFPCLLISSLSRRTNAGLAKEPARLCGRGRRWGTLDLRGRGGARLAHRVCSVHIERLRRW